MPRTTTTLVMAALALVAGATPSAKGMRARRQTPETVMITLRAKAGAEADLARVIATHWQVARRLDLVRAEPHVTLRTTDDAGAPCFIDVFTWRDEETPDNAPADIQSVWADMNRLTESRGGKPGLSISRVTLVTP